MPGAKIDTFEASVRTTCPVRVERTTTLNADVQPTISAGASSASGFRGLGASRLVLAAGSPGPNVAVSAVTATAMRRTRNAHKTRRLRRLRRASLKRASPSGAGVAVGGGETSVTLPLPKAQ